MEIQWDSMASLMRVVPMSTTEDREELVARGTLRELVTQSLAMEGGAKGLLLRAAGPDWSCEYEGNDILELATQPAFTGVSGEYDTADLSSDQQPAEVGLEEHAQPGQVGGPTGVHPRT